VLFLIADSCLRCGAGSSLGTGELVYDPVGLF
jgi:hypothetical protein